jgi:hypothetical protein
MCGCFPQHLFHRQLTDHNLLICFYAYALSCFMRLSSSLSLRLCQQDKNCLGLPKMNAPWASSSSLVSNVVPAPYELKPRLASTNVYIAVGLHPPSKHVHDKQELEDKDALFGACLKAARAALASMTTTFKPHASVHVLHSHSLVVSLILLALKEAV